MNWQPIETAPKNQRIFLWSEYLDEGEPVIGSWVSSKNPKFTGWTTGWETAAGGYDVGYNPIYQPSYWAPLPAAPFCCDKTRVAGIQCLRGWKCPRDEKKETACT